MNRSRGQQGRRIMADIWSCGVTLYAMLCGYLPFEYKDTNTLYIQITSTSF